jgi:hypothetical protein
VKFYADLLLSKSRQSSQCFANDPVQLVKLTTFVGEKLNVAQINCGGPDVFKTRYLENADPSLMQQIEKELTS